MTLSQSENILGVIIRHPSAQIQSLVLSSVLWSTTCLISCVLALTDMLNWRESKGLLSGRSVRTPFLAEPREPSPARDPTKSGDDLNSPAIEPNGGIDATRGRLQPIAARVLMKVL